jgi:hypothetical protein
MEWWSWMQWATPYLPVTSFSWFFLQVFILHKLIPLGETRMVGDPDPYLTIINRGIFYVLYSILLHLPPLRFHCVGGCGDRTQDCYDFDIVSQAL